MYLISKKVTVKGSDLFVYPFFEELNRKLGDRIVEITLKNTSGVVLNEISVDGSLHNSYLIDIILSALTETLKNVSVKMVDTTIISYEKYTFKVEADVLDAVRKRNEITYIMSYSISKNLKPKKAKVIANIIQSFHDTCASYFDGNKLIVDRYHSASLEKPLPKEDVTRLCLDARFFLSYFRDVQAIECEIKATGVELDT